MLFTKGLKVNNNTTISIVNKMVGNGDIINHNSYKLGKRMKEDD